MPLCPCNSQKMYYQCCDMYIKKKQKPQTPELLMRSRYTAYNLADMDYIKQTMNGAPLINFDENKTQKWAQRVVWLNLKIIQSNYETPQKGFVEFIASFIDRNKLFTLHEISEFHQEGTEWFYVDGINKDEVKLNNIPIARNNSCPCGSGKKFKNCHER
ncbi:MAG: YchJ family metal-binding protein [bacterium]|nr:YchJ family metal-binding protein [bacterium]